MAKVTARASKEAKKFARWGLDARQSASKSNKCCTPAGLARAHSILRGERQDAVDIRGWFRRHRGYYQAAEARAKKRGMSLRDAAPQEPAIQAWWIWGGQPMWDAAERAVAKVRNPGAWTPKWNKCFSRKKIAVFEPLIPEAYAEIQEVMGYDVHYWPSPIECMTEAEINEGRSDEVGHGLYYIEEERIKLNKNMGAWEIFGNFIHENIHHVDPELSERKVDQFTHQVLGRLGLSVNTEPEV